MRSQPFCLFALLCLVSCAGSGADPATKDATPSADEGWCLPPLSDPGWESEPHGWTSILVHTQDGLPPLVYRVMAADVPPDGGQFDVLKCTASFICSGSELRSSGEVLSVGDKEADTVCRAKSEEDWGCFGAHDGDQHSQEFLDCWCVIVGDKVCIEPEPD